MHLDSMILFILLRIINDETLQLYAFFEKTYSYIFDHVFKVTISSSVVLPLPKHLLLTSSLNSQLKLPKSRTNEEFPHTNKDGLFILISQLLHHCTY